MRGWSHGQSKDGKQVFGWGTFACGADGAGARCGSHVAMGGDRFDCGQDRLPGNRPALWVSDIDGAQPGHGEHWQVCLTQQLRDRHDAIDAGDAVFASPMRALLLRAVIPVRRHRDLAAKHAAPKPQATGPGAGCRRRHRRPTRNQRLSGNSQHSTRSIRSRTGLSSCPVDRPFRQSRP